MFGAIKRFFRKTQAASPAEPPPLPSVTEFPAHSLSPPAGDSDLATVPNPSSTLHGDHIVISYSSVLKQLPKELLGRMAADGLTGSQFRMSCQEVVEQLPTGTVRVPFGQLRRSAPVGLFTNSSTQDQRSIDLPLAEILPQLRPEAYSRRQPKVKLAVPDDVSDLFGPKGGAATALRVVPRVEAAQAQLTQRASVFDPSASAPLPTNPVRPVGPLKTPSPPLARAGGPPAGTPPSVGTLIFSLPKPALPSGPPPRFAATPGMRSASPKVPPLSRPISRPNSPAVKPLPKLPGKPAEPTATVPRAEADPAKPPPLLVELDDLAGAWPEPVREEIAAFKVPHLKVELPPASVCEGLKRGHLRYSWGQLRSWVYGGVAPVLPSRHADLELELPLDKLTPLFLEYVRTAPTHRRVASADNITEFFRKNLSGVAPAVTPQPASNPAPATPTPPPEAETHASSALSLSVSLLAAGWPEAVLREIKQHRLNEARLELPLDVVEPKLRGGKIEFGWSDLCAFIPGCPPEASDGAVGRETVSLPLSVVTPLFMKARTARGPLPPKTLAEIDIPNVFTAPGKSAGTMPAAEPSRGPRRATEPASAPVTGTPVASAPHTPTPPTPPTPSTPPSVSKPKPARAPAADPAAPAARPGMHLAELFGEPGKKSWTPKELVQATKRLPGVVGALVALHDGFLVASSMAVDWKSDATAAFLPQIFGRTSQCLKELNMGEAKSVAIGTPTGTLQVYQAGVVYLAVLVELDHPVPLDELKVIVNELSRRNS